MPNWIDEGGFDWYNKLECQRCLGRFEVDEQGEIPVHKCLGGYYCSKSAGGEYHYPVKIK